MPSLAQRSKGQLAAVLLPPYFLPSVSWLALALRPEARWATGGRFGHQSPLHRATVLTSAGPQLVSVPVLHRRDAGGQIAFTAAMLSPASPWARTLSRTLATAYRRAAYWPHYGPELQAILAEPPIHLAELNRRLMAWLLAPLGLPPLSEAEAPPALHWPAQQGAPPPAWFTPRPYFQCFGGFTADASALDLILNLGPSARRVLDGAVDEAQLAKALAATEH